MHELQLTLTAAPTAANAARSAVRTRLRSKGCDQETTDTAELLVSELVTNAVLHATGPSLCLTLEETELNLIHVAVRDGDRSTPRHPVAPPAVEQTRGRGLFLIDTLSVGWGWEPLRTGKRVWFELPCTTR
jgi:anti-sigma regulatory factor (Ser/Thr protein kinase)